MQEHRRPRTRREAGVEAHRLYRKARREQFLMMHDFTVGRGLEIGPLDSAVADESVDDVRFVDVFDRAGLVDHYRNDAGVILELIPEIDYPIFVDGRPRTLAEAARPGGPYAWIIASHVIEHVPDVVGWLEQLADVAEDGARLLLAVPDRRYCFDLHRPPTTVGQMLTAYEEKHTRPSLRAVYDFFSSVVAVDTRGLWNHERPAGRAARIHDRAYTLHQVERARAGEYVDCHVWTFTPQSLLEQVQELRALDLCDWYVERLVPVRDTVEFLAVLRRLPRGSDRSAEVPDEVALTSDLPDWLSTEWVMRERARRLHAKVRRLRARNRRLKARIDELESSARMRVGSAVVAPVAALRRRFARDRG